MRDTVLMSVDRPTLEVVFQVLEWIDLNRMEEKVVAIGFGQDQS